MIRSCNIVVIFVTNVYGPSAGALDAESPKSKMLNSLNKCFGHEIGVLSYGVTTYFACAKP